MPKIKLVEILEPTRKAWRALPPGKRQGLLSNPWVTRIENDKIFILPNIQFDDSPDDNEAWKDIHNRSPFQQLDRELRDHLKRVLKHDSVSLHYIEEEGPDEDKFVAACHDFTRFKTVKFGSPVAELDKDLAQYFVSTRSFEKARDGETTILIGPKGSGKSAILRELVTHNDEEYCIVITPEVFATSQLAQFDLSSQSATEQEQGFVATWIFTIFLEVFKKATARPQGMPAKELAKIKAFLRDQTQFAEVDLFSRFIGYLKRIEGIKVGPWELAIKTRELQKLYTLEDIYALVPSLRSGLKRNILILIDELDLGWDNSIHSNRFIAGLLMAATKVHSMGLPVRVLVLIRHEMFDLVKGDLDQLDKLRVGIDHISWNHGALASLIIKRAGHSLGFKLESVGSKAVQSLFPQAIGGKSGFEYLLSRTTGRPREVVQFVKKAHELSVAARHSMISAEAILLAEREMSQWKLDHVCSEYKAIYPKLASALLCFRGLAPFLSRADIESTVARAQLAWKDNPESPSWIKKPPAEITQILYSIDFIGVEKPNSQINSGDLADGFEFSHQRPNGNAHLAAEYLVHPAFWKALELHGG